MPVSEGERHVARRASGGWVGTDEAARQLGGVSRAQVRRLVHEGFLQAFDASKPGSARKDWRFRQEWIDRYLQQQTRMPNGAA